MEEICGNCVKALIDNWDESLYCEERCMKVKVYDGCEEFLPLTLEYIEL